MNFGASWRSPRYPTHTSVPLLKCLWSQGEGWGCVGRQICVLHCSWLTQEEAVLEGPPRAQPGLREAFKKCLLLFISWNWADAGDCHYARPRRSWTVSIFVSDTLLAASHCGTEDTKGEWADSKNLQACKWKGRYVLKKKNQIGM